VRIRAALPADAAVVAGIHHHGWTDSYKGLLPDVYLDSLDADACLSRWVSALADGTPLEILVAEFDGRVVGFVAAGPSTDPDATAAGEIWDLWVAADARSQGVGGELLRVALDHLAAGHQAALVWVLGENARGRTFYARTGAVHDGMTRTTPITAGTMTDVRYLWDLRGRVSDDQHDRQVAWRRFAARRKEGTDS
jgi:ribosomal protein S18 acetylase RimI-like enzyme